MYIEKVLDLCVQLMKNVGKSCVYNFLCSVHFNSPYWHNVIDKSLFEVSNYFQNVIYSVLNTTKFISELYNFIPVQYSTVDPCDYINVCNRNNDAVC